LVLRPYDRFSSQALKIHSRKNLRLTHCQFLNRNNKKPSRKIGTVKQKTYRLSQISVVFNLRGIFTSTFSVFPSLFTFNLIVVLSLFSFTSLATSSALFTSLSLK
jgi:hypothetical protein